jgi:hypothetical protein
MLEHHADPNQKGWVRIQGKFRQWSPLELAAYLNHENPSTTWKQVFDLKCFEISAETIFQFLIANIY